MLPWGRREPAVIRIEVVAGQPEDTDDIMLHARIDRLAANITKLKEQLMADLTELRNAVAENTSITDSVETLVQQLATQIENAGGNQEEIDAIVAELRANSGDLSALITQNTPAEGTEGETGDGTDTGGGAVGEPGTGGTDTGQPTDGGTDTGGTDTGDGTVTDPGTGDVMQA